jgi:predicted deacylase
MINRTAGGKKHGSLTERIAHFVLEKIVAKADYALEIITGTANAMTAFVSLVRTDKNADYDSRYLDYAKAFGCDLLWTGAASPAVMRNVIAQTGVQVIMTELAGDGYYEEEHVQYEMRGIRNVVGFLGIIDRAPGQEPSAFLRFDNFWMHAEHGGFFRRKVNLRQRVRKGDVLGRISDLLGNETEVVTAAHDGIVIGYRSIPRIYPGDWSVWVGNV